MLQREPPAGLHAVRFGRADEEHRPAFARGERHERFEQVRARDALGKRGAEQPRHPDERHAVGEREIRAAIGLTQALVALREDDVIDVRGDDVAAPRMVDE